MFPERPVCINLALLSKPSGLEFGKAHDVEWSLRLGVGEKYPEAVWAPKGATIGCLGRYRQSLEPFWGKLSLL